MARYGQAFKDKAVARLLPPEGAELEVVSREVGVSTGTLERWRADALASGRKRGGWTPVARLEAVIATASMSEADKSAWCRAQGLFPSELDEWRQTATASLGAPEAVATSAATRAQAKAHAFDYIEVDYNRTRLHSALDYLSPEEFELAHVA